MSDESRYAGMKVDELEAELESRGLPKSGKKDDLIARLLDDDVAQGGTAPEAEADAEARAEPEADAAVAPEEEQEAEARPTSPSAGAACGAAPQRRPRPRPSPRRRPRRLRATSRERSPSAPRPSTSAAHRARRGWSWTTSAARRSADARAILRHTPRAVAADISKLLESAVANAENNFELDPDDLKIGRAYVDEGPTIKRYRPRALGRATRINKRTSHMTITLTTADTAERGERVTHGTESPSRVDAGRLHPRLEVDLVLREGVLRLPVGGHPHPGPHRRTSSRTRGSPTSRSRRTRARWRSTSTPRGRAS